MKLFKRFSMIFTVALLVIAVSLPAFAADKKTTLLVSAAASTVDALDDVVKKFEAQNPNIDVKVNYGSSGALQKQIYYGGRADVYISADAKNMDILQKSKFLIADTRFNLMGNDLVLIVPKKPKNTYAKVVSFKSFLDPRVKMIAIGDPASVPAGSYAMEAAEYYKVDYTLNSKANKCKDVRQVLRYVESGNVDAGVVYYSDTLASDKVEIVFTCADESHKPIVYPAAAISRGSNPNGAKAFLAYLKTEEAKAIFKKNGFKVF